jgi:large subunit ribosomal protein L13
MPRPAVELGTTRRRGAPDARRRRRRRPSPSKKTRRKQRSPKKKPTPRNNPTTQQTVTPGAGRDLLNRSYYPTASDSAAAAKRWYVIDAEGQTLGRLASLAAGYVRGKGEATYTPSMDMGAFVVVVNADKVKVTGRKGAQKTYFRHVTGRPGSYAIETFDQLQARLPERIVEKAVRGMLPKGSLGRRIRTHLKVYKGGEHPHAAQQPVDVTTEISGKAAAKVEKKL